MEWQSDRWIKVSKDVRPKPLQHVIISGHINTHWPGVASAFWDEQYEWGDPEGIWRSEDPDDFYYANEVEYWMPFPEPKVN